MTFQETYSVVSEEEKWGLDLSVSSNEQICYIVYFSMCAMCIREKHGFKKKITLKWWGACFGTLLKNVILSFFLFCSKCITFSVLCNRYCQSIFH